MKAQINCATKSTKSNIPVIDEISNEIEDYDLDEQYYLDEVVDDVYKMPLFDGKARLTARMVVPAKHLDIWAEVSNVCRSGTLVSVGGIRDFLWLGFVDDKAVLRWNTGSGTSELWTRRVLTDKRLRVSARRYKKDAMLRLGSATATGSAQGRMSSMNADPFVYIGKPPENITRLSGTASLPGFIGCVHRLRVSGRDVIPPSRGLPVAAHGVRTCNAYNLAQLTCP